ncbi:uracil-DNA glycosylase family protein [soil metagenome]
MNKLEKLLLEVRACRACEGKLPLGPRPIVRATVHARVLIVGQAPGTKVHKTGVPWNDPSGDRLRGWLGVDRDFFYNEENIAIIPMGLCYPGKAPNGDMPPRKECAPLWFDKLHALLPNIGLTLLVGHYAQAHYLNTRRKATLTDTVANYAEYLPEYFPLPHPSPRNLMWLRRNDWFERDVVPALKREFSARFRV